MVLQIRLTAGFFFGHLQGGYGRHLASDGLSFCAKFLSFLGENLVFFMLLVIKTQKNWTKILPCLRSAEFKRNFLSFFGSWVYEKVPKKPPVTTWLLVISTDQDFVFWSKHSDKNWSHHFWVVETTYTDVWKAVHSGILLMLTTYSWSFCATVSYKYLYPIRNIPDYDLHGIS